MVFSLEVVRDAMIDSFKVQFHRDSYKEGVVSKVVLS